ncbi:hypothetical protein KCU62_g277, partial [Aureobasidium sp. EXF-3399]
MVFCAGEEMLLSAVSRFRQSQWFWTGVLLIATYPESVSIESSSVKLFRESSRSLIAIMLGGFRENVVRSSIDWPITETARHVLVNAECCFSMSDFKSPSRVTFGPWDSILALIESTDSLCLSCSFTSSLMSALIRSKFIALAAEPPTSGSAMIASEGGMASVRKSDRGLRSECKREERVGVRMERNLRNPPTASLLPCVFYMSFRQPSSPMVCTVYQTTIKHAANYMLDIVDPEPPTHLNSSTSSPLPFASNAPISLKALLHTGNMTPVMGPIAMLNIPAITNPVLFCSSNPTILTIPPSQ